MPDISQILCVVDPTADVQPALERAAFVARTTGAELELFICYYNEYLTRDWLFDAPALDTTRNDINAGLEKRLEEMAASLRDSGLTVRTSVLWDRPLHSGIVRHAAAIGADLVFKDTHHHSAVSRALFSNTDWNLIRSCASPLWLVKPGTFPEKPVFIAAIDPMSAHDKPAALDDEILVLASSIAAAAGAEVHAFHAFDPRLAVSAATANAYIPVSLPLDEIAEKMGKQHKQRFDEVAGFHGIDAAHAHLVRGAAHEELPDLARKLDAAVVVMGGVARSRLERLFIGSTAERTLEHLPCDLLIVKPPWFRAEEE
ncbi:MAG TPA: universal stress protein [Woeseiaceae bacterium]|nr:universal stress protein [Woeseiaceae bacterium]